jgi:N-acetyl-alpha-D-muramate 1-phosphate uridylyltransferase
MMRPPLMLFAAGFGKRMGALTADRPKPLVPVAGRALIDHALAVADAAQVGRIVVNLHYRGAQITDHLAGRADILFSDEHPAILETGGGLRQALPLLGSDPVLTLNTDAVWTGANPLTQLLAAWDDARMDGLLLLLPAGAALGHAGPGDFAVAPDGRISRGTGGEDHVYLGAQILKTGGLADVTDTVFSLNRLWDRMIADGRAYGVVHDGAWCDVGSPAGIGLAEQMLKGGMA